MRAIRLKCKNSVYQLISVVIGMILMPGCSSTSQKVEMNQARFNHDTTLIRTYTVTAKSMQDIDALNEAARKAVHLCAKTHERAEILDYRVQYQGMSTTEKEIAYKAGATFNKELSTTSERDYRGDLRFRCLSRQQEVSLIRISNQLSGAQNSKIK